jgi:glycine cleavage system H protein
MSLIPDGLQYTKEHEWVSEISANVFRMGITDYAQGATLMAAIPVLR